MLQRFRVIYIIFFISSIILFILFNLSNCGPKQISAFGDVGEMCTEDRSCPEGTRCKLVNNNYRCVERTKSKNRQSEKAH